MLVQAALIKHQGVSFAVVSVKSHVIHSETQSQEAIQSFSYMFPNMPIVLMGIVGGRPMFRGRNDLVRFLSRLHINQLPWRKYNPLAA